MIHTIKSDNLTITLDTLGAEIKSVKNANDVEFMWSGDPAVWKGVAPVLFPVCGGLKDGEYIYDSKTYSLTKHGFARGKEFEAESIKENSITFLLKDDEETFKCYPFHFELRINYLTLNNKLNVTYNVKNTGENTMYFSIGAHEAYSTPEGVDQYYIEFSDAETLSAIPLEGMLLADKEEPMLNNEKILNLSPDLFKIDAVIFKEHKSASCTLCHKGGTRRIKVEFEDFNQLLFWQVCGAKYLCIEPWCGMADFMSSNKKIEDKFGIQKLDAKKEYCVNHKITFEI